MSEGCKPGDLLVFSYQPPTPTQQKVGHHLDKRGGLTGVNDRVIWSNEVMFYLGSCQIYGDPYDIILLDGEKLYVWTLLPKVQVYTEEMPAL